MRILLTGARGNLSTALLPMLNMEGHELVLLDIEPMESGDHRCVQADIRDAGAVTAAMVGCEAVIHTVAYHGDMIARRNYDDYYGVNVTGTHNLLLAMVRTGVKYLVFSSSEVVYGLGMRRHRVMDESVPCVPNSIYSLTKGLGEELCRFYSRQHGMKIAMLRYGCFIPADWKVEGIGRLTNWVDRRDAAQANMLAVAAVTAEEFDCEPFQVHSAKPFEEADWPQLVEDPTPTLEKYWPGCTGALAEHGLKAPKIHTLYDISKAQRMLGYAPLHNFEEFISRLKREPPIS